MIKNNEVAVKGTHCSLLLVDSTQLAVLNQHEINVFPEALHEAFALLEQLTHNGHVAEFTDAPGHWAVKLIKTPGLPVGKSSGRI